MFFQFFLYYLKYTCITEKKANEGWNNKGEKEYVFRHFEYGKYTSVLNIYNLVYEKSSKSNSYITTVRIV